MSPLQLVAGKKTAICTHHNADGDAIGCAIALCEVLKSSLDTSEVKIVSPQGISRVGANIAKKLGYEVSSEFNPKEFEACILVDILNPEQISPYTLDALPETLIIIDHHYEREEFRKRASFYLAARSSSCAELVYWLVRTEKLRLNEKARLALLAAIISDTQHLMHANRQTFQTLVSLIESDGEYEKAAELVQTPQEISERIAHLKAFQHLRFERVNDFLLAYCIAGSFEANIASSLVKIGADVAVVAAEKKEGSRISARSRREMEKVIHLGKDVFEKLGANLGGSGGGHACAASANLNAGTEDALEQCVALVKSILSGGRQASL